MRALALVALISLPALAETPLSAKAFAAHVGSDTITYSYSTGLVGTADYGPERSLRWAFAGEPCFDGRWFARDDEICFAYTDDRLSACWHFFLDGDSLHATLTDLSASDTQPLQIRETARSAEPLDCPSADLGV